MDSEKRSVLYDCAAIILGSIDVDMESVACTFDEEQDCTSKL